MISQQTHNVSKHTTSQQRRYNVAATSCDVAATLLRRCVFAGIDVAATLLRRCVFAGIECRAQRRVKLFSKKYQQWNNSFFENNSET